MCTGGQREAVPVGEKTGTTSALENGEIKTPDKLKCHYYRTFARLLESTSGRGDGGGGVNQQG